MAEDRFAEAEGHFRRALESAEDHRRLLDVLANLGTAVAEQGRLREGIGRLERAHALAPHQANVALLLSLFYLRQADHAKAARLYRGVLAGDPDQADAHAGLAFALSALGEEEEARREARLAAAMRPESDRFRQLLAGVGGLRVGTGYRTCTVLSSIGSPCGW